MAAERSRHRPGSRTPSAGPGGGFARLRARSSALALDRDAPPRLRQLALGPHDREPSTGQAQRSLVEQIAGLPAGKELRVEAVEALDLEVGMAKRDEAAQQPFEAAPRTVHDAGEGGEVERDLLDPAVPQRLDRADDQELHQPVRRLPIAPHRRERHRRASVRGDQVQETADAPIAVAGKQDDAAGAPFGAERVHRHREAALARAGEPALGHSLELAERALVELGQLGQLRGVAALLEAGGRPAHPWNRPPLGREAPSLAKGPVASLEGAQPGLTPERNEALAEPPGGDRP